MEFRTLPNNFFNAGYTENYELSGTSTGGNQLRGNLFFETLAPTTFNGLRSVPIMSTVEIYNLETGTDITASTSEYYLVSDKTVSLVGIVASGITLLPERINLTPTTVNIGDSGNLGTFYDSQGDSLLASWRIENPGGGNANFKLIQNLRDSSGNVTEIVEQVFTVNPEGTRLGGELKFYYPDTELTAVLQATRTNSQPLP